MGWLETRLEGLPELKTFISCLALKNAALLAEKYRGYKQEGGQPHRSTNG